MNTNIKALLPVLCVTMMCLLILTDNPSHPYYQRSTHFVVSLTNEQSVILKVKLYPLLYLLWIRNDVNVGKCKFMTFTLTEASLKKTRKDL